MNVRIRLALRDLACTFGGWVIALVVAFTPLALTVAFVLWAVQRWG